MSQPLQCPNCQAEVRAEDINIQRMVAKCAACSTVFNFNEQAEAIAPAPRPEIPLPEGFVVEETGSELIIKVVWRKTRHLFFYILFTVFWNVVTIPFVTIAIVENNWTMALMISAHVAVGAGFLIYTLALLMNSTSIDVSREGIAIVTNPIRIPFNPNRYLESEKLEQLYVEQYVASRTNGRPNYAFAVRAVIQGQSKHVKLVKGLKSEEQALFIEHEVEKYLKIPDKIIH